MRVPLNVAAGLEGRRDTYGITPGEPESYYGGGAQSFAGYSPADNVDASRTNVAAYVDFATKPIENLSVDLAGRFEHYSDFGDAKSGKLTVRYDFTPQIAIRGTISNGFRAPTLAEGFLHRPERRTDLGQRTAGSQLRRGSVGRFRRAEA